MDLCTNEVMDALTAGHQVLEQSSRAAVFYRTKEEAAENPWKYLVGYDFADEPDDGDAWRPGGA